MSVPVVVGAVIAERYRVDGILGEGGMGVVVMATHLVLNQRVAIKFLRPQAMVDRNAVQRFVHEAQAAAKVQSEHVVRVQDVAMLPDGTPYIVMEYLEGSLLATMLASRGALPVREAIKYALQTCEALAETHAAGIVHGDLKPENIYIAGIGDAPRRVKLLDFGISKIAFQDLAAGQDGSGRKNNPKQTSLMGTPVYMAPELYESGVIDPSSDLWALGIVLYEMLAGTPPFIGDTMEDIRERVLSEPLTPVLRSDMPQGLDVVISRCLQKEVSLRYASVLDLTAALEDYSPAESSLQRVESVGKATNVRVSQRLVPTVVLPNRKTNHGTWALAALGLVGIVGLVLVLLTASHRFKRGDTATTPANAPAAATPTAATSARSAASVTEPSTSTPATTMAAAPPTPPSSSAKGTTTRPRFLRPATTAEVKRPPPPPPPAPPAASTAEGDKWGPRK